MAIAACTVQAAQVKGKEIHKTFAAFDRVTISLVSGDCEIKAGVADKILIDVVYDVDPEKAFEPSFIESGKTLRIKERWHGSSVSGDVAWTITVPPNTEIEFSTASGSLTVENLTKSVEGNTASGDFTITGFKGEIDVSTASGDVNLENVEGRIDVSTASGNVDAVNVRGEIDMSTASGDVEVEDSKGLDLSRASGSVEAAKIHCEEESEFSTASGHVSVALAETPKVDLDLSSASGRVTLDCRGFSLQGTITCTVRKHHGRIIAPFDFDKEEEFEENDDTYIRKTVVKGSPAPLILLETSSGSVTIKR